MVGLFIILLYSWSRETIIPTQLEFVSYTHAEAFPLIAWWILTALEGAIYSGVEDVKTIKSISDPNKFEVDSTFLEASIAIVKAFSLSEAK